MTAAKLPRRNWLHMVPADFDRDTPDSPGAEVRRVPAIPDVCGTAPMFGEDPTAACTPSARVPAPAYPEQSDTLF
ncbi:hypothetical protein SSP531S_58620 [Streptomyces spongiicola]|uniref:Uncharacterized protein n=1 Tax=Streptomyces spongiicola TaxID=1690221 RepID=A0A388T5Z1_9ACTN|nr:hypothetical protein [Streptomyces spongiicola]GBQ04368.1 hypothetical protein SSP531S_58620 [Streptomyces spongiicola]